MSKITMAFLFCLVSTIANAQNNFKDLKKTVQCGPTKEMFALVMKEPHKEIPLWSGLDLNEKTSYVIFHNEKTGSFSIIEFNDKVACLLGEGSESQLEKTI